MKFLVLRVLTHSELGMFHEYRRQGKEGSKQRAINFDSDVVDRVFPTALDSDRIELDLRYDTDSGIALRRHWLTRQAKNWRLEGNCPRDRRYAFVEPGCLFALDVDAGRVPATGSWIVLSASDPAAEAVLSDGATAPLVSAGMIALHGEEGQRIRILLNEARPDMFPALRQEENPMSEALTREGQPKRLPPRPARLAEIIANTGHTLASAVADIVDNSISADATEVDIDFATPNGGHGRWLTIRDNGQGMNAAELDEAMTLGSLVEYEGNSLGKFGYGLKGASWSQARVFTVVTRRRGQALFHLTWDRDNLGDWEPREEPLEDWEQEATRLGEQGTVVLWKEMKPPAASPSISGLAPWTVEIADLSHHLALVFHRFLEGEAKNRKKVAIRINGVPIEPNNPVGHMLSHPYDEKTFLIPLQASKEPVKVQPWLLPSEEEIRQHHKPEGPAIVSDQLDRIGLYGKRNETQGLFIYRNDRLIKWGGWHQMWSTSDEKTKLARVIVSFGTQLDERFDINITKREVSLPSSLQAEIKKLANQARNDSKSKYKKSPIQAAKPAPGPTPPPTLARPGGPGTSLPSFAPSPTGRPSGPPPEAVPTSEEVPLTLRVVTTQRFGWRIGPNLTGGKDLQVSDRFPSLAGLVERIKKDPEAIRDLAGFLALLDEKHVHELLLGEKAGQ